jgi:hypothetical protein
MIVAAAVILRSFALCVFLEAVVRLLGWIAESFKPEEPWVQRLNPELAIEQAEARVAQLVLALSIIALGIALYVLAYPLARLAVRMPGQRDERALGQPPALDRATLQTIAGWGIFAVALVLLLNSIVYASAFLLHFEWGFDDRNLTPSLAASLVIAVAPALFGVVLLVFTRSLARRFVPRGFATPRNPESADDAQRP